MEENKDTYNKKHLAAYLASMFFCGCVNSVLGPLIPYLAQYLHRQQTQFATMFLFRASGVIIAGLLIKLISKKFTFHTILIISSISISIASTIFSLSNSTYIKNIAIMGIGMSTGFIQISLNMGLMSVTQQSNVAFWLQLLSGIWSVGAIVGPFFVLFFQLKCYMIIGFGFSIIAPLYYWLQSPEIHKKYTLQGEGNENVCQLKQLPRNLQYRIGFLVFAFVGSIGGFFGWIFSFVVIKNLFTKERATNLNAIFYIFATFFKFALIFYNEKSSVKLKLCATGAIIALIFGSICCIFKIYIYGVLIGCVSLGLFCANLYAYTMSLPAQFAFALSTSQRANFAIIQSFGQVCLAPLIGLLMHLISADMLFYGVLFIMLFYYIVLLNTLYQFQNVGQKQFELQYDD